MSSVNYWKRGREVSKMVENEDFENAVPCPECGEPMLPELDDPERYYCEDCGREWIIPSDEGDR